MKITEGICPHCGGEPGKYTVLCRQCLAIADCEDYGLVTTKRSKAKEVRFVAAECDPGKSTGRERKHASMGDAENANGCWDNMVRMLET